MEEQSIGEQRVRTVFNPSSDSLVDQLKQHAAEAINQCDTIKHKFPGNAECARLASIAQTHFETAAMYAVKAATVTNTK